MDCFSQLQDFSTACSDRKQAWSADGRRQARQFDCRTRNCGQTSLPGDIMRLSESNPLGRHAETMYHNDPNYIHRKYEEEVANEDKIYVENVGSRARSFRQVEPGDEFQGENVVREHYFRDGNAEVLRLVTEDETPHQRQNVEIDGKGILLQRFIEDQKVRRMQQEVQGTAHDDVNRDGAGPSHPPEIILVPSSLDVRVLY